MDIQKTKVTLKSHHTGNALTINLSSSSLSLVSTDSPLSFGSEFGPTTLLSFFLFQSGIGEHKKWWWSSSNRRWCKRWHQSVMQVVAFGNPYQFYHQRFVKITVEPDDPNGSHFLEWFLSWEQFPLTPNLFKQPVDGPTARSGPGFKIMVLIWFACLLFSWIVELHCL